MDIRSLIASWAKRSDRKVRISVARFFLVAIEFAALALFLNYLFPLHGHVKRPVRRTPVTLSATPSGAFIPPVSTLPSVLPPSPPLSAPAPAAAKTTAHARASEAQSLPPPHPVWDIVLQDSQGFRCLDDAEAVWASRLSRLEWLQARKEYPLNLSMPTAHDKRTRVDLAQGQSVQERPLDRAQVPDVPVVFIQQQGVKMISNGYVDVAIRTACRFNRHVYVLTLHNASDGSQPSEWVPPDCAKLHWLRINGTKVEGSVVTPRLTKRLSDFDRLYVHMSGNPVKFERFCIERWFLLEALADVEGLENLFYADCDVLVMSNVSWELSHMPRDCLTHVNRNINAISGHSSYWSRSKLKDLSKFFVDAYDPDEPHLAHINKGWVEYQENYRRRNQKVAGGVCDMWLIAMFINTYKDGVCYTDPAMYDHRQAFEDSDFAQDELGLPYRVHASNTSTTIIPMKTLHFQGSSKDLLIACAEKQ